jgi:hypothetical protein
MLSKILNIKFHACKIVFGICFFFFGICAQAQCAMCRASLESEGNASKTEALNNGIVYLMAIPYILVALVAVYVYRLYTKKKILK